ncbi:MAG: hypothetical protein DDT38_00743 [Firmicutes bacterium]|nr:hypothetical protein [candidate division NPL-UPA2 bacterium]
MRGVELAKAQAIKERNRPCPHGKHVAHDAAHPGSRALVGLDGGGVVVTFDLKDYRLSVANIYYAGVFPGAHEDAGAGGGKLAQGQLTVFVATMLTPHHGKHTELSQVRGPTEFF